MGVLTYRGLRLDHARTLIGLPLGCTSDGYPLQVIGVEPGPGRSVRIELEEWDPPETGADRIETATWAAAKRYSEAAWRGQHLPPTAGHDPDKERPTPP